MLHFNLSLRAQELKLELQRLQAENQELLKAAQQALMYPSSLG